MIAKGYKIYKRSVCTLLLMFVSMYINEVNNIVTAGLSMLLNGIGFKSVLTSDDCIIRSSHISGNSCNTNFYDMV